MSSKRIRKMIVQQLSEFGKDLSPFGSAYYPTSFMSFGILAFGIRNGEFVRAHRCGQHNEKNRIREFDV